MHQKDADGRKAIQQQRFLEGYKRTYPIQLVKMLHKFFGVENFSFLPYFAPNIKYNSIRRSKDQRPRLQHEHYSSDDYTKPQALGLHARHTTKQILGAFRVDVAPAAGWL